MEENLTIKEIESLLVNISRVFQKEEVEYLVYGSYAYLLYTSILDTSINDIDIIIKKNDIYTIESIFRNYKLPYKLFIWEHGIHANHLRYVGNDGKPFDISLDAVEADYKKDIVKLDEFEIFTIHDQDVRVITKSQLISVYNGELRKSEGEKSLQCKIKMSKLKD